MKEQGCGKSFGMEEELRKHTNRQCSNKRNINFPQKHRAPKELYDNLAAVQSDTMDLYNRNKIKSNLTDEEKEALKELNKLKRERKIVIKPCDKGAGIII